MCQPCAVDSVGVKTLYVKVSHKIEWLMQLILQVIYHYSFMSQSIKRCGKRVHTVVSGLCPGSSDPSLPLRVSQHVILYGPLAVRLRSTSARDYWPSGASKSHNVHPQTTTLTACLP